jgi:hypothetical protein
MVIPAVYLSYFFGRFAYDKYMTIKAPEYYRRPYQTAKEKV